MNAQRSSLRIGTKASLVSYAKEKENEPLLYDDFQAVPMTCLPANKQDAQDIQMLSTRCTVQNCDACEYALSDKAKKDCIVCSLKSWEPARHGEKEYVLTESSNVDQHTNLSFQQCEDCQAYFCETCVGNLYDQRTKLLRPFPNQRYYDGWKKHTKSFLEQSKTATERIIMPCKGRHLICCEYHSPEFEEVRKSGTTIRFAHRHQTAAKKARTNKHKRKKSKFNNSSKAQREREQKRQKQNQSEPEQATIPTPTPPPTSTPTPDQSEPEQATIPTTIPPPTTTPTPDSLSGYILFDNLVAIKPLFARTQIHCLAPQDKRDKAGGLNSGIGHMVISPREARRLQETMCPVPERNKGMEVPEHTGEFWFRKTKNPLDSTQERDLKVFVVTTRRNPSGPMRSLEKGSMQISETDVLPHLSVYNTAFFEQLKADGVDIVFFLSEPIASGVELDGDLLCAVFLQDVAKAFLAPMRDPNAAPQKSTEAEIFFELWKLLTPLQQIEQTRLGGSNGRSEDMSEWLFLLMGRAGSTPRKSKAVMWTFAGTAVHATYCTPYAVKRKFVGPPKGHGVPRPGGCLKLNDQKYNNLSTPTKHFLEEFVFAKALAVPLLEHLNSSGATRGYLISSDALKCQNRTNLSAKVYSNNMHNLDPSRGKLSFGLQYLATSCSFSLIAYAVGYHFDTPSAHEKHWKAFVENKRLFRLGKYPYFGEGRGGAGPNCVVGAILDHSFLDELNRVARNDPDPRIVVHQED